MLTDNDHAVIQSLIDQRLADALRSHRHAFHDAKPPERPDAPPAARVGDPQVLPAVLLHRLIDCIGLACLPDNLATELRWWRERELGPQDGNDDWPGLLCKAASRRPETDNLTRLPDAGWYIQRALIYLQSNPAVSDRERVANAIALLNEYAPPTPELGRDTTPSEAQHWNAGDPAGRNAIQTPTPDDQSDRPESAPAAAAENQQPLAMRITTLEQLLGALSDHTDDHIESLCYRVTVLERQHPDDAPANSPTAADALTLIAAIRERLDDLPTVKALLQNISNREQYHASQLHHQLVALAQAYQAHFDTQHGTAPDAGALAPAPANAPHPTPSPQQPPAA